MSQQIDCDEKTQSAQPRHADARTPADKLETSLESGAARKNTLDAKLLEQRDCWELIEFKWAHRRNYTIIKIQFEAIKRIHLRYEDVQTRLGKSASDALNANSEAWKFRYQA